MSHPQMAQATKTVFENLAALWARPHVRVMHSALVAGEYMVFFERVIAPWKIAVKRSLL